MNNIQSAIAEIKDRTAHTLKTTITAQTSEVAIQALEKQMPKNILKADIDFVFYGCPTCDYSDKLWSVGKHDKHCPNCGQALDWSEENE